MADVSGLVKNDALYRCRSNVSSLSNLPRYSLALLGLGQRRLRRLASGQKRVTYLSKSAVGDGYYSPHQLLLCSQYSFVEVSHNFKLTHMIR